MWSCPEITLLSSFCFFAWQYSHHIGHFCSIISCTSFYRKWGWIFFSKYKYSTGCCLNNPDLSRARLPQSSYPPTRSIFLFACDQLTASATWFIPSLMLVFIMPEFSSSFNCGWQVITMIFFWSISVPSSAAALINLGKGEWASSCKPFHVLQNRQLLNSAKKICCLINFRRKYLTAFHFHPEARKK